VKRPLAWNLVLALAWAALWGSFTAVDLVVGLVMGFLAIAWLSPLLGGARYARKVPRSAGLALYFLWELVVSSLRVAWDVVTPTAWRSPGFVAIPLDAHTEVEITALANLVTLTPGSLSLDVSDDRSTLYVHTMWAEDPDAVRREIKEGFERRVLELLR